MDNVLGKDKCRPFPLSTTYTGKFRMCNFSCGRDENCTFPHNQLELDAWNKEQQSRMSAHQKHKFPRKEFPLRKPLTKMTLTLDVTRDGYKAKFLELLYHENQAHIDVLRNKCSGSYTVCLLRAKAKKPEWIKQQLDESWYRRVGYIEMESDRVAYAAQATRRYGAVVLQYPAGGGVQADILSENYSHFAGRLYIAFNPTNSSALESSSCPFSVTASDSKFVASVDFVLKHSYFQNLSDSVQQVPSQVINRIVPDRGSFTRPPSIADLEKNLSYFEKHCSGDQLEALRVIASCPSSGPPVVIAGPFGTGKSYILAIAARYFFHENKIGKTSVKILVCTQQRVSADSFASIYLKLKVKETKEVVRIIQSYGRQDLLKKQKIYWSIDDFKHFFSQSSNSTYQDVVVITTCLTARSLAQFIPKGYFTHILIDEGAQMREPEAIAPLSMVEPLRTKIVIAGDEQQMGPSMLVLGKIPRKYGLSVSLLERLHKCYQRLGAIAMSYHASLVTNYRSRSEILSLTGELFYDLQLRISNDQEPPTHPEYPYPLVFICSSVEEATGEVADNKDLTEVKITVRTLARIIESWPEKLWGRLIPSSLCIMSPSRTQLALMNEVIDKTKMTKLKYIQRHPTFDMQGREYRALVLSTAESINPDGSTKNPRTSFSDRYVFNTAITRAQSLVVAIGNPFLLLKMEDHMMATHWERGRRCWSHYLKLCLRKGTVVVDASLKLSNSKIEQLLSRLTELIQQRLPDSDLLEPDSPVSPAKPSSASPVKQQVPTPTPPSKQQVTTPTPPSKQQVPAPTPPSKQQVPAPTPPSKQQVPTTTPPSKYQVPGSSPPVKQQVPASSQMTHLSASDSVCLSSGHSRSILNEMCNKKLISKPNYEYTSEGQGFFCNLTFRELKTSTVTSKCFTVESDTPVSSKVKSREIAATKAIAQLEKAGIKLSPDDESSIDLSQSVPTDKSVTSKKASLAVLKEKCDKQKLKYQLKVSPIKEIRGAAKQPEFQATIKVTDALSSETIMFEVTGDIKTTKQDAKHAAADKAIHRLRDQQNQLPFQIIEPSTNMVPQSTVPKTEVDAEPTPSVQQISRLEKDYTHVREIAFGGFGVVHLVKSDLDKQSYALKMIPFVGSDSERTMREAQVLAQITHENILRYHTSRIETAPDDWKTKDLWKTLEKVESLYSVTRSSTTLTQSSCSSSGGVVFDRGVIFERGESLVTNDPPTCLCIFTEYCEEGTLAKWLLKEPTTRVKRDVVKYFDQILSALCYLHGGNPQEKTYIHRDLKPSNVFFKDGIVKVGDFGLVKPEDALTFSSVAGSSSQPSSEGGTPLYLSPEQLAGKNYNEKVDMYALGLILFELLYHGMATESEKAENFMKLKEGVFPQYFRDRRPDQSVLIINDLLQKDPKIRISAKQLQQSKMYGVFKKKMGKKGENTLPSLEHIVHVKQ